MGVTRVTPIIDYQNFTVFRCLSTIHKNNKNINYNTITARKLL